MKLKDALIKLGLVSDEDTETKQAEDAVVQSLIDEVIKGIGTETFVKAIQTMDAFVKDLNERVEAIETVVKTMAASDVERVHQLVTSGDWTKDLFTASKSGEEAGADDAAKAAEETTPQQSETSDGMEAFFGGGK